MEWIRTHPYASALCAAGILVLIGVFIVERQAARPTVAQTTAWGGGATPLLNPTSYQPTSNTPQGQGTIMDGVKNAPPYTYIPPAVLATSAPTQAADSYDFETFIAMLIKQAAPKNQPATNSTSTNNSILSAYAYIPKGLISTTTPSAARSDTQQALYDYGNEIGSDIESFEQQHSNMTQILKAQVEDRSNLDKAAAVANVGRALEDMGNNLSAMDTVPSAMTSAHAALAKSYIEIGKNLALVPKAERDSDFIQAIQTYNASADVFTKNYIQIVSLFGAYGVTFTPSDSGRVFTFSPSGF